MLQLNHSQIIVELKNVCFSYKKEEAIKNISLSVHKGDYVGIIGPNGGGKSTLVKLMLGILKQNKGEIKLFEEKISEFKDWYKIGYVPQRSFVEINIPITVEEVVIMGRYGKRGLFHRSTTKDKEIALKALENVDMIEYRNKQLSDLSGGQQQRVFIARALSSQPEILFLDEPTVGVDIKTQKQFYKFLRKLNKKLNLTLILISHELDVVAHESNVLGYINHTLDYFGEPTEFLKGAYFHELIGLGGLHH